jgi:hypothetical protein
VPSSADLDELCRIAGEAASRKGHEIPTWTPDSPAARRGTCVRCGRIIYVRIGGGMTGMAGAALSEACDRQAANAS